MNKVSAVVKAYTAPILLCSCLSIIGCSQVNTTPDNPNKNNVPSYIPTIEKPNISYNTDGYFLDTSNCNNGYVIVATNKIGSKNKLYITCGDLLTTYDMEPNKIIIVPVNMGDGDYTFRIMMNTEGNNYIDVCSEEKEVVLNNNFFPYMIPSIYCDYEDNDDLVKLAKDLASKEGDPIENIYNWVINNISYDTEKAISLSNSSDIKYYIPDPNDILEKRKGICLDYSSLFASMLRSIGVPAKVCVGYYDPEGVYHSWNEVYIDGEWRGKEFSFINDDWNMLDPTFSSGIDNYELDEKKYSKYHEY